MDKSRQAESSERLIECTDASCKPNETRTVVKVESRHSQKRERTELEIIFTAIFSRTESTGPRKWLPRRPTILEVCLAAVVLHSLGLLDGESLSRLFDITGSILDAGVAWA